MLDIFLNAKQELRFFDLHGLLKGFINEPLLFSDYAL